MTTLDLSLDAQLLRVVVPLVAVAQDAVWHPVGTAFVVTTFTSKIALLLTAAHNLKHLISIDTPPSGRAPSMPSDFLPTAPKLIQIKKTHFYAGVHGAEGFELAEVVKCWYQNDTDIAVVIAVLPPESPAAFPAALAIDPSPVIPGSELVAIGYAGMSARFLTYKIVADRGDSNVHFQRTMTDTGYVVSWT